MAVEIRPNIHDMTPYSPGKPIDEVKRELGLTDVVKLASNENPLGASPKAIAAAKQAAEQMHLYPDAAAYDLHQAMAEHLGVSAKQLAFGNGSDELIHLLAMITLGEPQHALVMGDPSFVRYDAAARLTATHLVKVPTRSDWHLDIAAMGDAMDENTRLVFVANPNNPTGTMATADEINQMVERLPEGALLVLDEAYREYAAHESDYPDSLALIQAGKPVVSMRTMSKAYGLAGLRIGYLIGDEAIIDAIERVREPFNVNSIAQAAAIAALGDPDHLEASIRVNREGLDRITAKCHELGLDVVPSYTNFICIRVGDGRAVFDALLRQGVIVRSGHVIGMPEYIRVSIGTTDEVSRFLDALPQALG